MRYPADQKEKARASILAAGANALRQNGFNGIGVDGLAASAGVTSGAFYSNFANKEALLASVIEGNLGQPFVDIKGGDLSERKARLKEFLARYISAEHRENPATGCVMPTLSADVSRSSAPVRQAYEVRMKELVALMVDAMDGHRGDRLRRAWSVVALMVGAISIAQAIQDDEVAQQAIDSALAHALAIVDPT